MADILSMNIVEMFPFLSRQRSPFIWLISGVILGALYLLAAMILSPFKAFMLIAGLPVCCLVFIRPEIGLYITVFAIPMENLGRFTDQHSLTTVSVAKILGLFTIISWLFHVVIRKEKIEFPRELVILLLFWMVGIMTLFYTIDIHSGMNRILSFFATFAFFFLVINIVKSRRVFHNVIMSLLIATLIIGIFAIVQRFMPAFQFEILDESAFQKIGVARDYAEMNTTGITMRSGGTSGSPHVYSANLLIAIPLYLYYFQYSSRFRWKMLSGGAGIIAVTNLFLTQTRAAMVVFVLVAILIAYKRIIRLNPVKIIAVILALVIISAFALPFMPDSIHNRLLDPDSYTLKGSDSFQTRISFWKSALEMLKIYWLFGMGIGNFTTFADYNDIAPKENAFIHNIYLQMFNEVGIFGFSLLLLFLYLSWRNFSKAEKGFREKGDQVSGILTGGLKVGFIAILVLGLSMDILHFSIKDWWMISALSIYLKKEAFDYDSSNAEVSVVTDHS